MPKQATDNIHSPQSGQFSLKRWQSETSRNTSTFLHTVTLGAIFISFSHILSGNRSGLIPWKPRTVFIHAYYVYHQPPPYWLKVSTFCNEHKLRRSSLFNILHPHDTIFPPSSVRTLSRIGQSVFLPQCKKPCWSYTKTRNSSTWVGLEFHWYLHKLQDKNAHSLIPCPSIRTSVSTS